MNRSTCNTAVIPTVTTVDMSILPPYYEHTCPSISSGAAAGTRVAAVSSRFWHHLSSRVSVLQPGGFDDASMDTVVTEPHLEALMQHVAGRLAVPGASAAAEVNVRMDSGSGITAMSEELVEVLRRQPGMMQTALTQAFVGHARVIMSLGQECDIVTQSCPLHLIIETL